MPEHTAAAADDPRLSWWWQFSTGPALGGFLALIAAVLAFIRIGHQFDESKRGNTEIARKNSEDQWWDTLKWTTEAKESDTKDAAFRTVAAVRIPSSLNQRPDELTVQQQRAVESILDIFGSSDVPEVQDAVAPIYQALRHNYSVKSEDDVLKMLANLNLDGVKGQHTGSYDMGFDFLIQSAQTAVFIEARQANLRWGPPLRISCCEPSPGLKTRKTRWGFSSAKPA